METSKFWSKLNLVKLLQNLNHTYLIGILMLLGLLLRLPSLSLGLWRDEGSTYFDSLPSDLGKLIETVIYSELNPPGFYLIMHQFAIAFGIIFLLFTPWLPAFLTHLHTGTPWNVKQPWLMRPKLFLGNIMSTIPLNSGTGQKVGLLLVLFAMSVEAKQLLFPSEKSSSTSITPPNTFKVTLVMCFLLSAAMLSVLSYTGRYMMPFAPFAWVIFGSWLIAFFQYLDRRWTSQSSRFSQQLAVVLLILLLILPNSIDALSLGNGDKSGIRSLAASFQVNQQRKTFYLVSPDKFGPTFGYYFAQHPVKFYGFARWHRPEIFSPQGYAELWNSPTLISDMEQRIQDKIQQGYQQLALIQESATIPADNGPLKSTSLANKFLSRLKQTYTLLEITDYPGIQESVTLYLFSIVEQK